VHVNSSYIKKWATEKSGVASQPREDCPVHQTASAVQSVSCSNVTCVNFVRGRQTDVWSWWITSNNAIVKLSVDLPVFTNPCYRLALNFCGEDLPFSVKMTSDMKFFFDLYCAFVQNVECWQKIAADDGLRLKIAVWRNTAHLNYIMPLNCTQRLRIRNFNTV
jgi:hypothetical protein